MGNPKKTISLRLSEESLEKLDFCNVMLKENTKSGAIESAVELLYQKCCTISDDETVRFSVSFEDGILIDKKISISDFTGIIRSSFDKKTAKEINAEFYNNGIVNCQTGPFLMSFLSDKDN